MESKAIHAVIEFLHAESVQNAAEIHCYSLEVYGTDTLDVRKVRRWVHKTSFQ